MSAITAEQCPFCAIVAGREPARVVWRNPSLIAFLPDHPATEGHTLLAPLAHVEAIYDLTDDLASTLAVGAAHVARALREVFAPEGLNLIQSNGIAATQTVPHLHVHVLPRWHSDRMEEFWPSDVNWSPSKLDAIASRIASALGERE